MVPVHMPEPKGRILVAEPDHLGARRLIFLLARWGFDPIHVTGEEGVWEVLAGTSPPRVLLIEWLLAKEKDPVQLIRELHARASRFQPHRSIVVLSERCQPDDISAALEAGADDFIGKPYDADELKVRLSTVASIDHPSERPDPAVPKVQPPPSPQGPPSPGTALGSVVVSLIVALLVVVGLYLNSDVHLVILPIQPPLPAGSSLPLSLDTDMRLTADFVSRDELRLAFMNSDKRLRDPFSRGDNPASPSNSLIQRAKARLQNAGFEFVGQLQDLDRASEPPASFSIYAVDDPLHEHTQVVGEYLRPAILSHHPREWTRAAVWRKRVCLLKPISDTKVFSAADQLVDELAKNVAGQETQRPYSIADTLKHNELNLAPSLTIAFKLIDPAGWTLLADSAVGSVSPALVNRILIRKPARFCADLPYQYVDESVVSSEFIFELNALVKEELRTMGVDPQCSDLSDSRLHFDIAPADPDMGSKSRAISLRFMIVRSAVLTNAPIQVWPAGWWEEREVERAQSVGENERRIREVAQTILLLLRDAALSRKRNRNWCPQGESTSELLFSP
jgi:CheY-like chemotaxis protein